MLNCYSQVTQEWIESYNGPGNNYDDAKCIVIDASGNVYVTGSSLGSGTDYDYATIKYNSTGVLQWVQRYNGPSNDFDVAYSLAIDASSNVYVTGGSYGYGTDYEDYATIKYNSSGVQQWVQRYNGPGNNYDLALSIAVDASGNVYVTGWSVGTSYPDYDYATIKYNSTGIRQWIQRYNGPGNFEDKANSLVVDASGNVYITGGSSGSGTGSDYATIKYNSFGVQQWVQRYNGTGNYYDAASCIAVDGAGNVYVTGTSTGSGIGHDYATIKYNASGTQQWIQRYNGPGNNDDDAYYIAVDVLGNVYVTGISKSSGWSGSEDYATIKYNASGAQQWVQRYNGPGNSYDGASSIAVDAQGNVYVTGKSTGSGSATDYVTIKYNSSGVQQWVQRYDGPVNSYDQGNSLAIDASSNVYVTGGSTGNGSSHDYVTIKYSQVFGIKQISNVVPETFSLSQNYPNPFNPSTTIRFDIANDVKRQSSNLKLVIYDVLGREVATLVNEQLKPGTYVVSWYGSNYPSGVYFYEIISGDYLDSKKMILLK